MDKMRESDLFRAAACGERVKELCCSKASSLSWKRRPDPGRRFQASSNSSRRLAISRALPVRIKSPRAGIQTSGFVVTDWCNAFPCASATSNSDPRSQLFGQTPRGREIRSCSRKRNSSNSSGAGSAGSSRNGRARPCRTPRGARIEPAAKHKPDWIVSLTSSRKQIRSSTNGSYAGHEPPQWQVCPASRDSSPTLPGVPHRLA